MHGASCSVAAPGETVRYTRPFCSRANDAEVVHVSPQPIRQFCRADGDDRGVANPPSFAIMLAQQRRYQR